MNNIRITSEQARAYALAVFDDIRGFANSQSGREIIKNWELEIERLADSDDEPIEKKIPALSRRAAT